MPVDRPANYRTPRGLFAGVVTKVGERGGARYIPWLQQHAANATSSGNFQNAAADQLNRLGVETAYADPNRKAQEPFVGKLLQGAGLGALALSGGALLGGLGGGGGAAAASGATGGGGLGGTLRGIGQGLGVIGPNGQLNPLRLAQLGLGAAGVVQGAQAQGRANQMLGRATAPINVPTPDLSPIFSDPSNPYQRVPGQQNPAQLAALQALRAR